MYRPALHGIGSGLIHRAAGGYVAQDFSFTKLLKRYLGPHTAAEMDFADLVVHGKPGDNLMDPPGQRRQHFEGFGFIGRFAHDPVVQDDHRIGTDEKTAVRHSGHGISLFP